MKFKTLHDAPIREGTRVLLRLDLNVPLKDGSITDDFRIRRALPTLEFLKKVGARTILVSHHDSAESLAPLAEYLTQFILVTFVPRVVPTETDMPSVGSFILCENLRSDPREEANDAGFAEELAAHADIFVNEAFSVSHRAHASLVGVPKFLPSYAGFLFSDEVRNLSRAFTPPHPFLFVIGGAKTETKLPLVKKFVSVADDLFIGGVLANDLFKAKGFEVGRSTVSVANESVALLHEKKIILPADCTVSNGNAGVLKKPSEVLPEEKIVDVGTESLRDLSARVRAAKFVLWNGPLGEYENGFTQGTEDLARAIAATDGDSIVGGGDTLACISRLNLLEKFSFVSTGGGAMLQFLADETLPGIHALEG